MGNKAVEAKSQKDAGPESPKNRVQSNNRDQHTAQGISANDATQNTTASDRNQITMQPDPQRLKKRGKAAIATCVMDTGPDNLHKYRQESAIEKIKAQGAKDQVIAQGTNANDATQNTMVNNRNQITMQPNPQ
eukprot:10975547-Ditylum_brightwellii.AAC.1